MIEVTHSVKKIWSTHVALAPDTVDSAARDMD